MKFLYFGTDDQFGLCPSYLRAAKNLGIEHRLFDYEKNVVSAISYGVVGRKLFQHFTMENWIHKINRNFVVMAREYKPDYVFAFTNAPITTSAILFLKTVLPGCKFVLVWPDSILNFKQHVISSLPVYDMIATYGSTSVSVLRDMTRARIEFIPLAGDPDIHGKTPSVEHKNDFGFVGGWRPERQKVLEKIVEHFPSFRTEIYGPLWKEKCKKTKLQNLVKGTGLHGMQMADFFNTTKINLNIIDDTNYPSANMRFFEILTAGGLELVSSCPEMENVFMDQKDLLYFHDELSMLEKISWITNHSDHLLTIKKNGHQKIHQEHNYTQRLRDIINHLE